MTKGSGYYDQQRLLGKPKPNVNVACVHCQSNQVRARTTRRIKTAPDYFWRNYTCDACEASFWLGVHFTTNETVYASTPPTLESFYRMCILFTHEDVLAGRWRPSIIPHGYGTIAFSFYYTRELAREHAEAAMQDWEEANKLAVQDLTKQQRNVLFAKTYRLYMEVVTKIDFEAQRLKQQQHYGRITPMTDEERANLGAKLDAKLARLNLNKATSEVTTQTPEPSNTGANENGHKYAE